MRKGKTHTYIIKAPEDHKFDKGTALYNAYLAEQPRFLTDWNNIKDSLGNRFALDHPVTSLVQGADGNYYQGTMIPDNQMPYGWIKVKWDGMTTDDGSPV